MPYYTLKYARAGQEGLRVVGFKAEDLGHAMDLVRAAVIEPVSLDEAPMGGRAVVIRAAQLGLTALFVVAVLHRMGTNGLLIGFGVVLVQGLLYAVGALMARKSRASLANSNPENLEGLLAISERDATLPGLDRYPPTVLGLMAMVGIVGVSIVAIREIAEFPINQSEALRTIAVAVLFLVQAIRVAYEYSRPRVARLAHSS